MKAARVSNFLNQISEYNCQHEWPEDCFCQAGDHGLVLDKNGTHHFTAFFEAFPNNPDTFIRGEGVTIADAENGAWKEYQRILTCPGPAGHEFEAGRYESGAGVCKHCGLFMVGVIPPIHACPQCGRLNWGLKDINGNFWCKECQDSCPDELLSRLELDMRKIIRFAEEEIERLKLELEKGASGET